VYWVFGQINRGKVVSALPQAERASQAEQRFNFFEELGEIWMLVVVI